MSLSNHVVICPTCGAVMDSLGNWPTYPNNYNRVYQSTFLCNNCVELQNPPSTQTLTVWVLYREGADMMQIDPVARNHAR